MTENPERAGPRRLTANLDVAHAVYIGGVDGHRDTVEALDELHRGDRGRAIGAMQREEREKEREDAEHAADQGEELDGLHGIRMSNH